MRASVVDKVGGQRALAHSHDMEMWLRIAAHSDVGHIEGADQAWHRDHNLSLSAREVDVVSDFFDRHAAFEMLFDAQLPPGIESKQLLGQARQALSREALTIACHLFDRGRGTENAALDLLEFAMMTQPQMRGSRQWRALQRRIHLGPETVPSLPWYVAQAALRRVAADAKYYRWARNGI
jgi:hypothetical protein